MENNPNDSAFDFATQHPFHQSHWPKSIVDTGAYAGGDRLQISWDLGSVTEKEKKQTIKQWRAKLPEFQSIRWLSIWSHVTQPLFDAACQMRNLECLQIKWSNVKKLDAIENMTALRYLHIGSSTKVESIQPLASLSGLRLLELENFKAVTDFSPLLSLTGLASLVITGSMWTRQDVGSLATYAQMTWLKSLAIDTTHVESLRPLANLKNLEFLDTGGKLPMEEYAWLAAKLPNTTCRWFEPYIDVASSGFSPCRKCNNKAAVILTGKRGSLLCGVCDKGKLQKQRDAFAAIKQRAMTE